MKNKILNIIPRVIAVIFVILLFLLSFDGFTEFNGWKSILIFGMHLAIPVAVLIGTIIAWKNDLVGAITFLFFALYYIYLVGLNRHWSWYTFISGPALLASVLFFINWLQKRKVK